MAYRNHDRFVMGGNLTGGPTTEIWACSINGLFNGGSGVPSDYDTWLSDIVSPLSTWFGATSSRMRSDATLTYVKLNPIGPDGKYRTPSTPHTHIISPVPGGVSPVLPDFVSLAWSWSTANAGRVASHGRIYPPNSLGSYSTGSTTVGSTEQGVHVTAAKALLTLLAATYSSTDAFVPTVESSRGGAFGAITGVRVGNVLDVQRRRKDKFRETYVSSSWP